MDNYFNPWKKKCIQKKTLEEMWKKDENGKKNKKKKKHKKKKYKSQKLSLFFILVNLKVFFIIVYFVLINQYKLYKLFNCWCSSFLFLLLYFSFLYPKWRRKRKKIEKPNISNRYLNIEHSDFCTCSLLIKKLSCGSEEKD